MLVGIAAVHVDSLDAVEVRVVVELDPVAQGVAAASRRAPEPDPAVVPGAAIGHQGEVRQLHAAACPVPEILQATPAHDDPVEGPGLFRGRVLDLVETGAFRRIGGSPGGLVAFGLGIDPESHDVEIGLGGDFSAIDAVSFHPVIALPVIDHLEGVS